MKIILLITLMLLASACSVTVPVHEAEPPEALDNWGFRLALLEGVSPQIAPTDHITSDPAGVADTLEGFRFGFGFLERFQFNTDLYLGGFASAGSSFALKYQWTGDTYFHANAGNYTQTTILRTWSGSAADVSLYLNGSTSQSNNSEVKANGWDLTHLWGYRPASFFGFYGGPKVLIGHVTADYETSSNGPIVATGGRDFWGGGALTGLFLSPHCEHLGFDLNLEAEFMNLPQTYSDGRYWYTTFMVTLGLPFSFN